MGVLTFSPKSQSKHVIQSPLRSMCLHGHNYYLRQGKVHAEHDFTKVYEQYYAVF